MRFRHDRHDRNLSSQIISNPSPKSREKMQMLTPLAVLTGFALNFGNRISLASCGTAAIISTNLATTLHLYFLATFVLSALRLIERESWCASSSSRTISVQQRISSSA